MRKHSRAVKTGFKGFDDRVMGLRDAELVYLAAGPAVVKTSMALDIAAHVSLGKGKPPAVALFSMAADKHTVMKRLIAAQARVDLSAATAGKFPRSKWKALFDAAAELSEAALYIDDSSELTASSIRSRCEGLSDALRKRGSRLGLVIIDFLQLIHGAGRLKPGVCGKTAARGAGIIQKLKTMAVALRAPVIVLSQPEPLGDSDIPVQADIAAFVRHGPAAGKTALFVAKNPRGRTGPVPLESSRRGASSAG